jgi:hypothetical protein
MNQSQIDAAVRRAMSIFDNWLDTTGLVEKHGGYYCELSGLIEDAVHCGAQEALGDHAQLDSEK